MSNWDQVGEKSSFARIFVWNGGRSLSIKKMQIPLSKLFGIPSM